MRFRLHGSGSLVGIQIDWAAPVERGPELRAAMGAHDVDQLQAGVLRRSFLAKATLYARGAIALRVAAGHEIFLQLPTVDAPEAPPAGLVITSATVDHGEVVDRHRILVGDRDAGARIDLIVVAAVPTLSRAVVQRLIDDGHVTVAGQPVWKSNRRLRRGDVIEVDHPRLPAASVL